MGQSVQEMVDERYVNEAKRERGPATKTAGPRLHAQVHAQLLAIDLDPVDDVAEGGLERFEGQFVPVPPEPVATPEVAPLPPTGAPAETPEEAEGRVYDAFRRAYVQMQCGRREKDEEPLELILSRFQLDQETWQAHLDAAKEDEATWADLQTEVDRTCPAK